MLSNKHRLQAVILVGGKSSRMKEDKTLVLFRGKPMVECVLDTLDGVFEDISFVGGNLKRFVKYKKTCYEDIFKSKSPAVGIATSLTYAKNDWVFVTAADMPLITVSAIKRLVTALGNIPDDTLALLPKIGPHLEPLFAFYNKKMLNTLTRAITKNALGISIHSVLAMIKFRSVDFSLSNNNVFTNINTPLDLSLLK